MNTVLVTVLVPTFNVDKYIKDCFDSIFNQTFQNFNVLVIDDASTDDTIKIIESFESSRIEIVKKKNTKGLIDSLNIGFKMVKSKYIARVDADDINHLSRFQKQFNFLEMNPTIAACGCWLQSFGNNNHIFKHKETHDEIMCSMFFTAPMSLGATMLRKEAYENVKFNFNKLHVEDYDFWARTGFYNKMHNLQEVLYYYRVHSEQVCSKYRDIQLKNKIKVRLYIWKKLEYDQKMFTDHFLIKMLMSYEEFTIDEFRLLKEWSHQMLENNKTFNLFQHGLLKNTLEGLISEVLFYTFIKNRRIISRFKRFELLSIVSLKWKLIGIFHMFYSKIKYLIKNIR